MSDRPIQFLAGVQCFRCGMKHVVYEVEELEDGTKLGFYHCTDCRSQFYDTGDIMPYIMRLKLQLQRIRPLDEKMPGMTTTRPP